MNKKYYKKIKLSGPTPTKSPWPPTGLAQSGSAALPASSASNNPATPGQTGSFPGTIYAPYIPLYTTAGDKWKLTAYLLTDRELILPLSVYEKSIECLNFNVNSVNGTIPKIVNWELDGTKSLIDTTTLVFRSFEKHWLIEEYEQIQTNEGVSVKIPRNDIIPYNLNVTLGNFMYNKKSKEISDAFEKSYHDRNTSLWIYLKGTMTVIKKEMINDISNPHDPLGAPWKVYGKQNLIKEIIPKTIMAMEGTKHLPI